MLSLPGNTHVGFLSVFKMSGFTDVFGAIEDYECDPGEVPGGGHGEPGGEATCDLLGTVFLSAGADVGYTADTRAGRSPRRSPAPSWSPTAVTGSPARCSATRP